ncbi:MAG: septation protein A [Pseudomonadota bacterium]|nr:septation protein A [Pseudomonadota bacterium]
MKLLLDFLPIILFFGTFKIADIHPDAAAKFATEHLGFAVSGGVVGPAEAAVLLATVVVIVATLVQIALLLAMRRKVDTMLWVTFVLVAVLGGATVWFHNPTFIKWKPSVLYWAMSVIFWTSQTFFNKNVLRSLVGEQLELPTPVWQRLNLAWVAFFALMGIANLYVAYNYSTSTWASFKVFGLSGLMIVFMFAQGLYISRFLDDDSGNSPERLAEKTVAAEPERRP